MIIEIKDYYFYVCDMHASDTEKYIGMIHFIIPFKKVGFQFLFIGKVGITFNVFNFGRSEN